MPVVELVFTLLLDVDEEAGDVHMYEHVNGIIIACLFPHDMISA